MFDFFFAVIFNIGNRVLMTLMSDLTRKKTDRIIMSTDAFKILKILGPSNKHCQLDDSHATRIAYMCHQFWSESKSSRMSQLDSYLDKEKLRFSGKCRKCEKWLKSCMILYGWSLLLNLLPPQTSILLFKNIYLFQAYELQGKLVGSIIAKQIQICLNWHDYTHCRCCYPEYKNNAILEHQKHLEVFGDYLDWTRRRKVLKKSVERAALWFVRGNLIFCPGMSEWNYGFQGFRRGNCVHQFCVTVFSKR